MNRLAVAVAALALAASIFAAEPLAFSCVGRYEACKKHEGWRLNTLQMFAGRLYIGQGDGTANTGPTDVAYYDLAQGEFVKEFTVDEEAILRYRVLDGRLVIPGADAMESWELGNIYVRTDGGWVKRRTVPRAVHVLDIASLDGAWFAAIGTSLDFSKEESVDVGAILFSRDQGATWRVLYTTQSVAENTHRFDPLISYNGKLYGFPYAFTVMRKSAVPREFQPHLSNPLPGHPDLFAMFAWDPIGPAEVWTLGGGESAIEDIVPGTDVCRVWAAVYGKSLVLVVLSGKHVEVNPVREDGHLVGNAMVSVYAYDGQRARQLDVSLDVVRAIVAKEDRLLLLGAQDGQYRIAETPDLQAWRYYSLPAEVKSPTCLEFCDGRFFVGTQEGYLFQSDGAAGTMK